MRRSIEHGTSNEIACGKIWDEIANANYTDIRQFKVPNVTNLISVQDDLNSGSWKWADCTANHHNRSLGH